MMHELTFNELVAESQWKLQSDKITEKTGKRSHNQYLYCSYYSRDCNKWVLSLFK